jgi:hypothetical protein
VTLPVPRFQAWFDDSGTKGTGRVMVISGIFGTADLCAAVADDWNRALESPRYRHIRYFKMDDACGFDEEFIGLDADMRDAKVLEMAKVIDRPDLLEIPMMVDLQAFERAGTNWKHIKGHHSMKQPYVQLCIAAITTAITEAVARGCTEPVEIVFDEQNIFKAEILNSYIEFREDERKNSPERFACMPSIPGFRDDRDFVLLQAADLLAGEARLTSENSPNKPSFVGSLCPNISVSKYGKSMDDALFAELDTHLRQALRAEDKRLEEKN